MHRQIYPSDLTDGEWCLLEPLVPGPKPGGRPAKYPRREVINATRYVLRTGCAWRMLPHDFPPWQLVYHYFWLWRRAGTWQQIHDTLYYFKNKYFSMALFSSMTYHLSMLAVMTLVPIVVEGGLGKSPLAVTMVLLPHQLAGLVLPSWAGMIYDKYDARWLQPGALVMIAIGIGLLALFAAAVPIWALPMLLFPASIGTSVFNAPNNAQIMSSLPESRSFAAGMLETSTQMGHTVGSTIGATVMGLTLPATIALMTTEEAQPFYRQGFQNAAMTVVGIIILGSVVAIFRKASEKRTAAKAAAPRGAAAPIGAGDGDG